MSAYDLGALRTPAIHKLIKLLYPMRDSKERLDDFYKALVEAADLMAKQEFYEGPG